MKESLNKIIELQNKLLNKGMNKIEKQVLMFKNNFDNANQELAIILFDIKRRIEDTSI